MKSLSPITTLFIFLLLLPATSANYAQNSELRRLIGNWELTRINVEGVKGTISFTSKAGQTTGAFRSSDGKTSEINDIRFQHGAYSFRVPSLNLVFKDLKFVGTKLEGNLIDNSESNPKGRLVPLAVRMTKK